MKKKDFSVSIFNNLVNWSMNLQLLSNKLLFFSILVKVEALVQRQQILNWQSEIPGNWVLIQLLTDVWSSAYEFAKLKTQ